MQQTPSKRPIETLPRTPDAGCLFVPIDDWGSRARKKQRKPEVRRALGDGILDDANLDEWNNPRADEKQIVDGVDRLPQIIGYDHRRHMLLPHSLLEYSHHVEKTSKMPDWFESGMQEFTRNLLESQFRRKPLIRNHKERNLGADLIFMALPTGLKPERTMRGVPSWNHWDDTLPYHFFAAAKPLLTDTGCLALLYPDSLEYIQAVLEGLKALKPCPFRFLRTWSIVRNTTSWGHDDVEVIF
jgi:hypothetical protein